MHDWLGDKIDSICWELTEQDKDLIASGGWDYSIYDVCDEVRNEITTMVKRERGVYEDPDLDYAF